MQAVNNKDGTNLRVGLVGPLPPPFGGMANQTRQLANLLTSEGVDVFLVQTNSPYCCELVSRIKGGRAMFRLAPYLFELWHVAKRVDCLHVMANSGWSWQLFAAPAVWIGWLRNVPVIINYRGGEAEQYLSKSIKWVAPTLKKSSALIVPSDYLKSVFDKFCFSAKVIPNIVDFEKFVFKGNLSVQNKAQPRLVIARNLEAIYGIHVAIRAVSILRRTVPRIKLVIAGSGPLLEDLIQQVDALDLSENVEFTGKLSPDKISELYAGVDIMLNPTTVDNMPNSVLEALACGIPVVTTNVGGIPYIVSDNETALMIDVNDSEMMANKVAQLINDDDLYKKLVLNGVKDVEKYAWGVVKQQWISLYRQLKGW